ncbi:YtxH domain-containing protein [Streptomyces millisiae]|uniref:YtxH domain-containing protein n=1 Tax=Streptomyces millisiae TaxID=3075542 RepID=A0ABU2LQF4_9ACTN|nr:YtxH domain-containing protein [Streptomyces sp. DSM 44918]MDT0319823.1 YtxH domain-containing protein [Streptomyces sp. DSM 44918]
MMRKLIFIAGLAVGYVLGARAGRERYEQLREAADRARRNPTVRNTVDSASQAGLQAAGRAAGVMADRTAGRVPSSVTDTLRSVRDRATGKDVDAWHES